MRVMLPATAALVVALAACDGSSGLLAPGDALGAKSDELSRTVSLMDACDPATFNAALGPGTCVRSGGITLQQFTALLQQNGSVGAWRMSPGTLNAQVGQMLLAVNRGGEVHTFTEVEEFGGGIVEALNTASGNTEVAPECMELDDDDFVAPGATYSDEVEEAGSEHYQCCIHPWMRMTVNAR